MFRAINHTSLVRVPRNPNRAVVKVLFITTETVDCINHVRAWDSLGFKADHVVFNYGKIRNDWRLIDEAHRAKPDVMFYIGANRGSGIPRIETLCELRKIAPFIHLCCDAADQPWHTGLNAYKNRECFDLQVAIDGGHSSPVDLAVLTPVDSRPFTITLPRDIRCGFSGGIGSTGPRSETIPVLKWFGGLTIRSRTEHSSYSEHVRFMCRCKMILNVSYTGSGHAHHIKGRVLEAGWAGCALLEFQGSPIGKWFPSDCYISWRDVKEAAYLIKELDDKKINHTAKRLAEEVRERYTARHIYNEILGGIGCHVGSTESRETT